jgi:hypothetical protein
MNTPLEPLVIVIFARSRLVALVTAIVTVFCSRLRRVQRSLARGSPNGKTLASGHAARPLFGRRHPVWIRMLAEPHSPAAAYEAHR